MAKGFTIKDVSDLMKVSINTVWYSIKVKKIFKKVYLAECGNCSMIDREEVMKYLRETEIKEQQRIAKKEAILNKVIK